MCPDVHLPPCQVCFSNKTCIVCLDQRSGTAPKWFERTNRHRDHLLGIHLITTRMNIATDRCTANRYTGTLFKVRSRSSHVSVRSAAPQSRPIINPRWLYWYFGQYFVFENTWFEGTCNDSTQPWLRSVASNRDHHSLLEVQSFESYKKSPVTNLSPLTTFSAHKTTRLVLGKSPSQVL